jgi:hypothetical protein
LTIPDINMADWSSDEEGVGDLSDEDTDVEASIRFSPKWQKRLAAHPLRLRLLQSKVTELQRLAEEVEGMAHDTEQFGLFEVDTRTVKVGVDLAAEHYNSCLLFSYS